MASPTSVNLEPFRIGSLPFLYLIPDYISPTMEQHFLTNILATQSGWKHVSGRRLLNIGGVVSSKGSLLQTPMPSWGLQSLLTDVSNTYQLYNGALANHVLINSYTPGQGIISHQDGPLYYPAVAILSLGSPAIIRFTKKKGGDVSDYNSASIDMMSGCGGGVGGDDSPVASVVLPPRSLFIFKDDAYEEYLHGIDFVEEEIVDESVVNPLIKSGIEEDDEIKSDKVETTMGAGEEIATLGEGAAAPPVVKRDGTRVSLTIRRVLKVHSLGILRT